MPQETLFDRLEAKFFGTNTDYDEWRAQLRQFWQDAKEARKQRNRRRKQLAGSDVPQAANQDGVEAIDATDSPNHTTPHPTRPIVDIGRLPSTPYIRLAGRERDLALLDSAFAPDSGTKLLSMIAWGGLGKTALINDWLQRIQGDGYRGADAVLAWSFYTQGIVDLLASSDLFLAWALDKLGADNAPIGPAARGEALAGLLQGRRVILILDGVEALQLRPSQHFGELRDLGLRTLLRRFAAEIPRARDSLILLTSRLAVRDIAHWEKDSGTAVLHVLEALSPAAGADLLRDNGVHGVGPQADVQLQDAARDFGGHPLTLSLLAAFLRDGFGGDVRSRDRIGALLLSDARWVDEQLHGHARRVMRSIQTQWLDGEPVLLAIMEMVALFDRPAMPDCVAALTDGGGVLGLSEPLAGLSRLEWSVAVARLRKANLLLPPGDEPDGSLDAHPLVREWFGEGLQRRNADAWRRAHARLYEHFRQTKEGDRPSREALEPLYRAIVHGCRANLHRSALMEVYADRICRQRPNADISNYAGQILGAVAENLRAISAFFLEPYERVHPSLDDAQRHWVLSEAAFGLRETGRLNDAIEPQRLAVELCVNLEDWVKACIAAYNLSEIQQYRGRLIEAIKALIDARIYAERTKEPRWLFTILWFEVQIRTLSGDYDLARSLQQEALAIYLPDSQTNEVTTLRRLAGCEIDLRLGDWSGAKRQATKYGSFAAKREWPLPSALAKLYICLSECGRLKAEVAADPALQTDPRFAKRLGELTKAFDLMVDAIVATNSRSERPRGYIARARFRIFVGDWNGAEYDLAEADEIAWTGMMFLYVVEVALLRGRSALMQARGVAPLAIGAVGKADDEVRLRDWAVSHLRGSGRVMRKLGYLDLQREWDELISELDPGSLIIW